MLFLIYFLNFSKYIVHLDSFSIFQQNLYLIFILPGSLNYSFMVIYSIVKNRNLLFWREDRCANVLEFSNFPKTFN